MTAKAIVERKLFFLDIDTQVDFMLPTGALYVPQAEDIIPNLRALINYARKNKALVLSSADAHPADDPSFAQWPPHCIVGTPGQQRIPETQLPSPIVIPDIPGVFTPPAPKTGQIILEKTDYDISSNPNFDALLASLSPAYFVAFGVATEYCVQASVLALRRRRFPVALVTDAIQGITGEGARRALREMEAAGVQPAKTEDIRDGKLPPE